MAHFLIKPAKDGCKFDFISTNGHTVCTSEVYKSLDGCKNGIESVKKNAALNKVEDLTENGEALTNHKFQIFQLIIFHFGLVKSMVNIVLIFP